MNPSAASNLKHLCLGVVIAFHALTVTTRADVLVSNLGNTNTNTLRATEWWAVNPNLPAVQGRIADWVHQSFSTGVDAILLESVTLSVASSAIPASTGFTLELLSDAGGMPGSSLLTLNGNGAPVTAGLYDYTPAGAFTLQAGTTYWLYAHITPEASATVTAQREFILKTTSDTSQTGFAGYAIGDTSAPSAQSFDFVPPPHTEPLQFAVNGTVPEPTGAALLLTGSLVLIRRRRNAEQWRCRELLRASR